MNSRKQKIARMALQILKDRGIEGLTFQSLSRAIGLDPAFLSDTFSGGERELLMDTVEVAGRLWVDTLRADIEKAENTADKLACLAHGYVTGSEAHPSILSVYIDLWKLVKDQEDDYVRNRLGELYQFYISSFGELLTLAGAGGLPRREGEALSLLFTVLSDVVHVQSVTLEQPVDFQMLSEVVTRMLTVILQVGKAAGRCMRAALR